MWMDIGVLLSEIADSYRGQAHTDDKKGWKRISSVNELNLPLPPGLEARGRGGMGYEAHCPWIGIFDPDVSDKSSEGLYLAYIFAADYSSVALTLQQGVNSLIEGPEKLGKTRKVHDRLRRNVQRLREHLTGIDFDYWNDELNLRVPPKAWRPRAYEAGSVAARRYVVDALPPEKALREDLWRAEGILQSAASVDRRLWYFDDPGFLDVTYTSGHGVSGTSAPSNTSQEDRGGAFRPKDSADYVALIRAHRQVRERRHEALIRDFVEYISERGYEPLSVGKHPRDLVLRRSGVDGEWLVEAKVVKECNPKNPVREAIGQLYEYRHFLYVEASLPEPHLVALFTEDIYAFSGYLEAHGIASVWRTPQGWAGSESAVGWGLVDTPAE